MIDKHDLDKLQMDIVMMSPAVLNIILHKQQELIEAVNKISGMQDAMFAQVNRLEIMINWIDPALRARVNQELSK